MIKDIQKIIDNMNKVIDNLNDLKDVPDRIMVLGMINKLQSCKEDLILLQFIQDDYCGDFYTLENIIDNRKNTL